jgi:hypothetical protein
MTHYDLDETVDKVYYKVHIIFTEIRYSLYMTSEQYFDTKTMLNSDPLGPTFQFDGYSGFNAMLGALMGKRVITGSKYKFVTMEAEVLEL